MSGRTAAAVRAVRIGAGLFRLRRGVIRVTGGDRVRWLDGMLTNDVTSLVPGDERSGCYAAALTRQGRIVADLQVLIREDAIRLDTAADALSPLMAHLDKFIIADDVQLTDESAEFARLGVEGPAAFAVVAAACGEAVALAPDSWREVAIAGAPVVHPDDWLRAPHHRLVVSVAGSTAREQIREALDLAGLRETIDYVCAA